LILIDKLRKISDSKKNLSDERINLTNKNQESKNHILITEDKSINHVSLLTSVEPRSIKSRFRRKLHKLFKDPNGFIKDFIKNRRGFK
jgi:hypothetical protein